MKIFGINISVGGGEKLAAQKTVKIKKRATLSQKTLRAMPPQVEIEMGNFKTAIMAAKNIDEPNRQLLLSIYESIITEAHLASQLRTALFTIQQSDFKIMKSEIESKDLKKLFEKSWFTDFVNYAVDAEFFGFSLVEFGDMADGEFINLNIIDRYHVVQEYQKVKLKTDESINDAIFYGNNKEKWFLIEIGDKYDLGLLQKAVPEVIWKNYARSDWSTASERFGTPLLSINTDTSNEAELDELENMAQNFGANGYIIGSRDTEISIIQPDKGTQFYMNYRELAKVCDEQISKLINGQTATSDEKSFVGSAEVQERVLNTYVKGRMSRIQREINDKLIPFLIFHGYPLQDCKFHFVDMLSPELKPTVTSTEDEKKKPDTEQTLDTGNLNKLYEPFQSSLNELSKSPKLDGIFERLIKKIHALAQKKNLPDELLEVQEAKDLLSATAKVFESAINIGIKGITEKPDDIFLNKLTKSVWLFSGFKTERQLLDISESLVDADGKITPFNKFRDNVLKTHRDYNINWLNAEYNMAASASQTAAKWNRYSKDGDRYLLQYRTAGDERVRGSHAVLNRVTLPLSHDFWNEHYPPNGWGCRCTVVQVIKSKNEPTSDTDVQAKTENFFGDREKIFAYNPGKQEAIFPPKHPYYNNSKASYDNMSAFINVIKNKAEYDSFGVEWSKEGFDDKTGAFLVFHKEHSFDKKNGKFEKLSASILFKDGNKVLLQSELSTVRNLKIFDGFLNEIPFEIKVINSSTANSVKRNIETAYRQSAKIVVLYFETIDKEVLHNGIAKWRGIAKKEKAEIEILYIADKKVHSYK